MEWRVLMIICVFFLSCMEEQPFPDSQSKIGSANITLLNDDIKGEPVVIYINNATKTMVAFSRKTSLGVLEFNRPAISANSIFEDNLGNSWSIFGEGLSADNRGEKLKTLKYLYGYWFVFPAFFDSVQVFQGDLLVFAQKALDDVDWLVPTNGLSNTGGLGFLPSIDNPDYINADEIVRSLPGELQYPDLNSLATVVRLKNDIFIYPHLVLNYHEIVNDTRNGIPFTLSFCPLTQTSQLWLRTEFEENTFGVSGLLYNNNLLLYDRKTQSYWSQVMQKSVFGQFIGTRINTSPLAEMTLASALRLDGNKYALSLNTGSNRDYDRDFYEAYKKNRDAIFHPLIRRSNALPAKEKVLGIITSDQYVKIYRYQ